MNIHFIYLQKYICNDININTVGYDKDRQRIKLVLNSHEKRVYDQKSEQKLHSK